jgi:hypothetical protein
MNQMRRRRQAVLAASPAHCQNGKLCHYVIFDDKTAIAIEDRIGRCDEDKPKPKKERPAAFS